MKFTDNMEAVLAMLVKRSLAKKNKIKYKKPSFLSKFAYKHG